MNKPENAPGGPAASLAKAIVRSLTRGTPVAQGVRYIHVGHENWLAAQDEVLSEVTEDGHSETKFVRGAYGAGKSHFLSVVQDRARALGWMTSHVECKTDHVQIDRFETLYPGIVSRLTSSEILESERVAGAGNVDPLRLLLERWAQQLLRGAGVREDAIRRPFDADSRLYAGLQQGLLRTNLPHDFTRALTAFARASAAGDTDTIDAVCVWLRGADEKCRLRATYLKRPVTQSSAGPEVVELRPIGKGTAHDVMRGLLWLVRAAGYAGLVLCIDEVEELAKLPSRKRQDQALQALREYVDHAGGDGGYRHLCLYLAATPEMFEGESYFPRYDALATRIMALGPDINWRAPVIDLDRTPLSQAQMREMANRIHQVHRAAYGALTTQFTDRLMDEILSGLLESRFRIAKPRLLARVVVDELERARQAGAAYAPPDDVKALIAQAATHVAKEASA